MKPLPMSPESLQAWRDNRKAQTRRVITTQPPEGFPNPVEPSPGLWNWTTANHDDAMTSAWAALEPGLRCPFGRVGESLWVKEALAKAKDGLHAVYRFDREPVVVGGKQLHWRWQRDVLPARFMPKKACRYVLWSKSIRAERLKDISFDDCLSEGIISTPYWCKSVDFDALAADPRRLHYVGEDADGINQAWTDYVRGVYFLWWDAINAGRGFGTEVDPWVWVVEIPRIWAWREAVAKGWRRRAA